MHQRTQVLLFLAIAALLTVITYVLLASSTAHPTRALTAYAEFWNSIPISTIDRALFAAIGTLLLYPVLLRPLVLAAYRAAPTRLRFLPRNFIKASNFRLLFFSLLFAAMSGLLIGVGIHAYISRGAHLITAELLLGMYMGLCGLLIMNFQFQCAYIRASLKKRELLESIIAITLLLAGFVCIGRAVVA